ncbi:MAG TPA: CHAD domain-containing protein [Pyrinomonadaceae bacterium]|nr:CHAD domain-containing protein [Pyrinomonadaceae bacterium]
MAKAREVEGLDCRGGALEGVRRVLATRFDEMHDYRAAALDFTDIEGVHAMRVASRRLRSALRDFKPYLKERVSGQRLKKLADALGAVRDEDVAIEALTGLTERAASEADAETAEGVRRLVAERERRREGARRELEQEISEGALDKLREKFFARLERATANDDGGEAGSSSPSSDSARDGDGARGEVAARLSFLRAGRQIIAARSEELRELSASLYRPFEVEPLHRMRIAAKRLRYAVEIYGQCFGERLKPFGRKIAALQKSLGELHDCDVWIEDFGERLSDAPKSARDLTAGTRAERRAASWLLRHFVIERTRHYTDARDCWQDWETDDFFSRLLEAFDAPPEREDESSATMKDAPQPEGESSPPKTSQTEPATVAADAETPAASA